MQIESFELWAKNSCFLQIAAKMPVLILSGGRNGRGWDEFEVA